MFYRLLYGSRKTFLKGHKRLSKMLDTMKRILYSCDIPGCVDIGENVKFSHSGLGVVVHGSARIGAATEIMPNVVIGKKNSGVPMIGKNCYIGAGAIIMGGIKVGDNAKIGANAVVITDVKENDIVVGNPARSIKDK